MRRQARQALLAAAWIAVIAAFAAPEASSVPVRSAEDLNSGTYQVVVVAGGGRGTVYRSLWHLHVVGNRITGTSEWDCCPGYRRDRLAGTVFQDGDVSIDRFCSGQGQPGSCEQQYHGSLHPTRIEGGWTGTGGSGSWVLYLDRVDIKFTVQAGGGESARLLLDDAQILGGGRLVDLSYDNRAQKGTAVIALRLDYTGGPEVRVSFRYSQTIGKSALLGGLLDHVPDEDQDRLFVGLQVFQSNAPTGRTRYGCFQVGQHARLVLNEGKGRDTAELEVPLDCGRQAVVIRWGAGTAAVTLTRIHGHG